MESKLSKITSSKWPLAVVTVAGFHYSFKVYQDFMDRRTPKKLITDSDVNTWEKAVDRIFVQNVKKLSEPKPTK